MIIHQVAGNQNEYSSGGGIKMIIHQVAADQIDYS